MKKTLLIASCLMITMALSAQIIHVPNDYSTIQEGINAADNGDTVLVDNGTYYENINFLGKAITVASNFILDADTNHINNTVIDGSQPLHLDSASVVTFRSGEDTTSVLIGFTITGGSGTEFSAFINRDGGGIFINESGAKIMNNKIIGNAIVHDKFGGGGGISCTCKDTDCWVIIGNNIIKQNSVNITLWAGGGGIHLAANARIYGNIISANEVICTGNDKQAEGGGIYCEDMGNLDDVTISDNVIANNIVNSDWSRGAGIQVYNSQTTITNNDIYNNETFGKRAAGSAIGFYYISGNILIKDNQIHENNHNVDTMGVAVVTLRELLNPDVSIQILNNAILNNHNDIAENSWTAPIWLWDFQSTEVIIDGNRICSNSGGKAGGLYARDSYNFKLTNNVFDGNLSSQSGGVLYLHQYNPVGVDTRSLIANNTFVQNEAGYSGGAIYLTSSYDSLGPVIMNNIFWQNVGHPGNNIYYWGSEDLNIYNNDIDEDEIIGKWRGDDNFNSDPQFVDDSCHIQCFNPTPCINHGIEYLELNGIKYYAPLTDIDHTTRPLDFIFDVGADETSICDFIQEESNYRILVNVDIHPNPAISKTNIHYQLRERKEVMLKLFSMRGELVEKQTFGMMKEGDHVYMVDLSYLPDGIYLLRLQAGKEMETAKIVLRK